MKWHSSFFLISFHSFMRYIIMFKKNQRELLSKVEYKEKKEKRRVKKV